METTWSGDPPETLLTERFHITTGFHPGQREIIEQLVQGKRVLAIQRTGWGKSLCYQMASLYYPHLTVVLSPLKALMRDQCQRCNNVYGIPSAIVSSDFDEDENQRTLERAADKEIKILYIAPERLSNTLWKEYVPRLSMSMIVIDEAHCISTWGHDFRPDYQRIVYFLHALPKTVPVLALTATANKRVETDILQQMGPDVLLVRGSMQRPNLCLNVVQLSGDREKLGYLGELLRMLPGTGIIYAATQRDAEMIAMFLRQQEYAAEYYHAGREDSIRQTVEQQLMANQWKVVCSTNALGMGIDKADIRFIIHYHLPASPIHYYQEVGRAGRDGQRACCILLYDPEDLSIQRHFIEHAKPDRVAYERVLVLLKQTSQGMGQHDLMRQTGQSQTTVRTILSDLERQQLIERNSRRLYAATIASIGSGQLADYDVIRNLKLGELSDIVHYAEDARCYMAYLTSYLGDTPGQQCGVCGQCQPDHFPTIQPSERMQQCVTQFLSEEWLPAIEKRGGDKAPAHEAGWSLAYYGTSRIGQAVRSSKYEGAGPFPQWVVERAVAVIKQRYPLDEISGIVSVPPTKSGSLVERFSRDIAERLNIPYWSVVVKARSTQEQKCLTNWVQKADNVKEAFLIQSPEAVVDRSVLLIDDIYDSGYMLREVGRTLRKAGAVAVYPFTITRTAHSDDQ